MSQARTIFRWTSLTVICLVGLWLIWPTSEVSVEAGPTTDLPPSNASARYVIKFSPGAFYMPGYIPFGIGSPMKGLGEVIRKFEAHYPDTRVEVVTVPMVREYLVTQLSSGSAPDIVNVNVEDVWTDVQKGWYVALDPYLEGPNRFIREQGDPSQPGYNQWWDMFKYQAISRGKAAPDNLNYCLSYDMIETGIYYNKNMFREVGAEVPENWDQFLVVLEKIKKAGHIPILMNIDSFTDWCNDLFFDQLYSSLLPGIDLVKDPVREAYLQGYLDWDEICFLHKKGFFTAEDPRYAEMWRLMHDFRQYSNADLTATDLIREFVTQKAAMFWFSSQLTYRLIADRNLGFEWGVFYLPQFTKNTSKYASGKPMCVIGGSANQYEVTNSSYNDTGDPKTSEKLDRVIALLQFMTVPENHERIVNEVPILLPNIVGVAARPELRPFEEILARDYTTTKWVFTFDLKFAEIQRRMLELYLNDGISLEEFLDWAYSNLDAATQNLLKRKHIDLDRLQATWDELAPIRAHYEDLPPGARVPPGGHEEGR